MTEPGWVRHGLRIGLVEYRRTLRAVRKDAGRLVVVGLGVAFFAAMLLGFAYLFMDELRAIEGTVSLPGAARSTLAYLWVFAVYVGAARTLQQNSRIDAEPLVLTTVSARTAAMGLVLSELLRALTYVAVLVAIVTGVAVYAFGSAASLVAVPAGVTLFALSGLLLGQAIGFAGALVVSRVPTLVRYKTQLGLATIVAVVVGVVALQSRLDAAVLQAVPVGGFADLLVVGTPVVGSSSRIVGALAFVAVELAVVGVAVNRLVEAYWFSDPVQLEDEGVESTSAAGTDALEAASMLPLDAIVPGRVLAAMPTPAIGVARRLVVRLQRNPGRLSFLLVPTIFAGEGLYFAWDAGVLEPFLMPFAALFVPWLAGAAFALNPLGDDGNVLPVTVTSGLTGRQYLLGLATPGLVLGLPVVLASVVVGGVYGGYDRPEIAGVLAAGLLLLGASVVAAPAIGMRFPRFTAISLGRSRDVIPPSITTAVLYTLTTSAVGGIGVAYYLAPAGTRDAFAAIFGLVIPGILRILANQGAGFLLGPATAIEGVGDRLLAIGPETAHVYGTAIPLVLLALFAVLGTRSVVRRFDGYTPE